MIELAGAGEQVNDTIRNSGSFYDLGCQRGELTIWYVDLSVSLSLRQIHRDNDANI